MAIHIIGETPAETREDALPFPEVELPRPESAPEAEPVLDLAALVARVDDPQVLIRAFAVRRLAGMDAPEALEALRRAVADPAGAVARAAIDALREAGDAEAVDAIEARFRGGEGVVVAEAAIALASLAPERLVEAARARSRLDDYGYAITTMALARSAHPEAQAWLSRALDRSGAAGPERRTAVSTAALLAGDPTLSRRVLLSAVADSRGEATEGRVSVARLALAAAAGLPASMAGPEAGPSLFASLRPEDEDPLDDEVRRDFVRAMQDQRPADAIRALAVTAEGAEPPADAPVEVRSAMARCRVLLDELTAAVDRVEALAPDAGVLFVAAAMDAAAVLRAAAKDPGSHGPLVALATALELDPVTLRAASVAHLSTLVAARTDRELRRLVSILTGEPLGDDALMRRLCEAVLVAGRAEALVEAAAEARHEGPRTALVQVASRHAAALEPVVLGLLGRRPLEPAVATLALALTAQVATQRLALAVGRRFLELRKASRFALTNAVLRLGDPRLAPLVEARAFAGEPEEVAWVLLALLGGAPVEGKLDAALRRVERRDERAREEPAIQLPLRCERCEEVLTYGFEQVYVDPDAKEKDGDPAFVGRTECKACGTWGRLAPTDEAVRLMTESMVGFLMEAEQRGMDARPVVVPRKTRLGGKELGVAAALRAAEAEVDRDPEAMRGRLRRGRLRLLTRDPRAIEDGERAVALDPASPEARFIRAGARAQSTDLAGSVEDLVTALQQLEAGAGLRTYDEDLAAIRVEVEQSLVQLESLGIELPPGLPLEAARAQAEAREQELQSMADQLEAQRDTTRRASEAARAGGAAIDPEAARNLKRNDPCPCGSGKKFKRCHGA